MYKAHKLDLWCSIVDYGGEYIHRTEGTENYFNGEPIYGIVTSSLDENGNPIFSSNI